MQQERINGHTEVLPEDIRQALEPSYAANVAAWITDEEKNAVPALPTPKGPAQKTPTHHDRGSLPI